MYKRNLWLALLTFAKSRTLITFLLNLDRIGNALAGGHYGYAVSGRVGHFANVKGNPYWKLLAKIIDYTFKPVDGVGHCENARRWELSQGVVRYRRSSDIALAVLSILVIAACILLIPIIRIYALYLKRK